MDGMGFAQGSQQSVDRSTVEYVLPTYGGERDKLPIHRSAGHGVGHVSFSQGTLCLCLVYIGFNMSLSLSLSRFRTVGLLSVSFRRAVQNETRRDLYVVGWAAWLPTWACDEYDPFRVAHQLKTTTERLHFNF